MASTGFNGEPILILSLDEALQLENIMIESDIVKYRDPIFIKFLEFKSEVISLAKRNLAEGPGDEERLFPRKSWEQPFLERAGCVPPNPGRNLRDTDRPYPPASVAEPPVAGGVRPAVPEQSWLSEC